MGIKDIKTFKLMVELVESVQSSIVNSQYKLWKIFVWTSKMVKHGSYIQTKRIQEKMYEHSQL